MESVVLSIDKYPKPNADALKRKNNFKADFSTILKSLDHTSQEKVPTTEEKRPKTVPQKKTTEEGKLEKDVVKKLDSDVETEIALEEEEEKFIDYEFDFTSQIFNINNHNFNINQSENKDKASLDIQIEDSIEFVGELVKEREVTIREDLLMKTLAENNEENILNEGKLSALIQENEKELKSENEKGSSKLLEVLNTEYLEENAKKPYQIEITNGQDKDEGVDKEKSHKLFLKESKVEDLDIVKSENQTRIKDESFSVMNRNETDFSRELSVEVKSLDEIESKEIIEQIVDKFTIDLSKAKNEIKIRLKPEVLGDITMSVEVIKDTVIAKIMVDNHRSKEIIEGGLNHLKEGIKDSGLEIKTFEVFVGNSSDFDKHNFNQFNFKQNNKRIKIKPKDYDKNLLYDELVNNVDTINLDPYETSNLNLLA